MPLGQETGFLNRKVEVKGVTYRFQVYVPEDFRRDEAQFRAHPAVLCTGVVMANGSEGMFQTQIGLPLAVRDHPERWPFIIVMPQCLFPNFWTDPVMLDMANGASGAGDGRVSPPTPARTYLTNGLSMGGYGATGNRAPTPSSDQAGGDR